MMRCEKLSATIPEITCIKRQMIAQTSGGKLYKQMFYFGECLDCEQGKKVHVRKEKRPAVGQTDRASVKQSEGRIT